jgi:hypothetical protein
LLILLSRSFSPSSFNLNPVRRRHRRHLPAPMSPSRDPSCLAASLNYSAAARALPRTD